jgi:hypothetical protein
MSEQSTPEAAQADTGNGSASRTPKVEWDDSKMRTTYANVVNAASTREEISVFFGTNQTWNVEKKREVTVQLSDRILLSPFAAKRLWVLLGAVLKQHEARFGQLNLEDAPAMPTALQGDSLRE